MKDSNVKIGMRVQVKTTIDGYSNRIGVVDGRDCFFGFGKMWQIVFDGDSRPNKMYFYASEFKEVKV